MLLDIPGQEKQRVGFFIDAKRRSRLQQKDDAFTVEQFIQGVCARQTYANIVKGITIKDSEIYDQLLDRLGFSFLYDDCIKERISSQELVLLDLLKSEQTSLFFQQVNKLIDWLLPYAPYALESVLLDVLCKLTREPGNKQDFQCMLDLFPFLSPAVKEITGKFLLQDIYTKYSGEYQERDLRSKGILDLKERFNKLQILELFTRWELYYGASSCCDHLLQECHAHHDIQLYPHVKLCQLFLLMQIQPSSFEDCKAELEQYLLAVETDIATQFYHICGLYYYAREDYDSAWNYFLKAIDDPCCFFPEIIYLHHIAAMEHKVIPSHLQECVAPKDCDEDWLILYEYYRRKELGYPSEHLEDYLYKNCKPLVRHFYPSSLVKEMLRTELEWLTKETGHNAK